MVKVKRLVDTFIRLVETASVSGRESAVRDLLQQWFQQRGLTLVEDEAGQILGGDSGNLLLQIPGTMEGSTLLFAAHMDTVEPGIGVKAIVDEDGFIRSKGNTILGSDDKAAIAVLLEVFDILKEKELSHPPLEFLFTVSEEQGLKGAKAFDFRQLKSKIAYVLDAGDKPGAIIIQSPCQNEMEYTALGRAAHAGINPEDGLNAIQLVANALAAMPCGRIDDETTCNFGGIEGGTARNIVAEFCRVKGEARSLRREKLDLLSTELKDIFIAEVEKRGGKAEVVVKFLYPEISLDENEEVVQLAARAARNIGLKPHLLSTGGGSDASIINGQGIRCANLGVGMRAVHTCNEHISIEDLVNDARWVLAIIEQAARIGE